MNASARFPIGHLVATPNAVAQISPSEIFAALGRHAKGDWGDVDSEDRASNDRALIEGTRLFSVYHTAAGIKFWIITEADRSSTCVLLPEDY